MPHRPQIDGYGGRSREEGDGAGKSTLPGPTPTHPTLSQILDRTEKEVPELARHPDDLNLVGTIFVYYVGKDGWPPEFQLLSATVLTRLELAFGWKIGEIHRRCRDLKKRGVRLYDGLENEFSEQTTDELVHGDLENRAERLTAERSQQTELLAHASMIQAQVIEAAMALMIPPPQAKDPPEFIVVPGARHAAIYVPPPPGWATLALLPEDDPDAAKVMAFVKDYRVTQKVAESLASHSLTEAELVDLLKLVNQRAHEQRIQSKAILQMAGKSHDKYAARAEIIKLWIDMAIRVENFF